MKNRSVRELIQSLDDGLRERVRSIGVEGMPTRGEFVLYWMQTAIRVDENPALNAAVELANRLELPVFVYQALSERATYASDRHHTFVLQGARDVQASFAKERIGYAFHLERSGHRGPHLATLANRSALAITEDMPVEPQRSWTAQFISQTNTPVVVVDTACVAPMRLIGRAYDRAYAFRAATQQLYDSRLSQPMHQAVPKYKDYFPVQLPFDPVDLQSLEPAELVHQCEIDHSIGPVWHTVGGSTAGYERWNEFKRHGMANYAKLRNNALIDGVSRMSPYLHFGMVSPMRIAREAAAINNEGAQKYLDELLIWRELAYAFCFYRDDHATREALPDWAQKTLAEHETDPRPDLLAWETLARGQTGDLLWDAAQRSLLMHGELHNNVRMTWGKAILNWTTDAASALSTMIDLNHRYALDGQDPSSFGGILWCLGQFDRPFPPARPIFGTVRDRCTTQHAKRLDPEKYLQKTTRPLNDPMPTVAVIGAGLSGLICARTLVDHGFRVTVFEKSRGVGGRMATRRSAEGWSFDHGAQYFTCRDQRFARYVESWQDDGIVQPWEARIVALENGSVQEEKQGTKRFVAVPGMNAICKHIAIDLNLKLQTQVAPLQRRDDLWQIVSSDGEDLGQFDVAVVSTPSGQAADLLEIVRPLADRARKTKMQECWTVMLAATKSLGLDFAAAFVHGSPLSWIARNSSKPGRSGQPETWVLQASSDWSHAHFEEAAEVIADLLLDEFGKAVGQPSMQACHRTAHRWRFALAAEPLSEGCLFDRGMKVAVCGDWCAGARVEAAFLSGMSAAGRVMGLLRTAQPSTVSIHDQPLLF